MRTSRKTGPEGLPLILSMLGLTLAFWLIGRPYAGLYHDARLYALQALARLYPESLGQDLFLRFGSQDAFTLFSPLYARLIAAFGLEESARLLTLFGHIWWLGGYLVIARKVLGPSRSLLALAIVAALPGYYGAWSVFRFAEPFLTPRLIAEASVLTAIALAMDNRRRASLAFASAAVILHPLMGAGGALVAISLMLPVALARAVPALVLTGLGVVCAVALTVPVHSIAVFDPEWLELIRDRGQFLLMQDWNARSWDGVITTLAALWILGSAWPTSQGRRLFMTSICVGCLGIVITLIGASIFKIVILTQGQAWRWTWVSAALVAIAAIQGLPAAWRSGPVQRASILLLLSGWLLVGWPAVVLLVGAVSLWSMRAVVTHRMAARSIELVAFSIAISSTYLWTVNLPAYGGVDADASLGWPLLQWLRLCFADGFIPVVIAASSWWLMRNLAARGRTAVTTFALSLAALALLSVIPDLTANSYQPHDAERLARWQQLIPPDAEVLWPENATGTWFLLRRRNYLSADQAAGIVFSRTTTMEMLRRSKGTRLLLPPAFIFGASVMGSTWPITPTSLSTTCRQTEIDFVISSQRLAAPRAAETLPVTYRTTPERKTAYLYPCNVYRAAAAT